MQGSKEKIEKAERKEVRAQGREKRTLGIARTT
jgi:hypothetical protein